MKTILSSLLAALATTAATAQARYDIHRYDAPSSSYENSATVGNDIENARLYILRSHPSIAGTLADSASAPNALLRFGFANQIASGDYLHSDGNHTTDLNVLAGGEMNIKGIGTLYGRALYSRFKQRGMYQNYAIRPDDYAPYLVSDTTGIGAAENERYLVEGGLSMSSGRWHYGVSGFYEGISTAKKTLPRRSAYNYWFRIGLSVARVEPGWMVSLKAWPEINKQSVSASSTQTPVRFLQSYGFGQWNRKESTSGYGYGRDAQILGAGGEALFRIIPKAESGWDALLTVGYNYRWMQTEESNFKNLYSSKTHRLWHNIAVSKGFRSASLHLLLAGEAYIRSGAENVYENRNVDQEQSLYDYVLVGTNDFYHRTTFNESLRIKGLWRISPIHEVGLTAGARLEGYNEKYDSPQMVVKNYTVAPQAGINYVMDNKRSCLDINITATLQTPMSNTYDLGGITATPVTEMAQAYIPYLLRGESRWLLHASAAYWHSLGRGRIGAELSATHGKRTDAPYIDRLSSPFGTARSTTGIGINVFYMF